MRADVFPQANLLNLAHRIQPQAGELGNAKIHRGTVRSRLQRSFDVSGIVNIGSHARGTAIRRFSDLDMLVVLRRNQAKWGGDLISSSTVLRKVIEDLQERFPLTEVGRDGQAAVVWFGASQQSLDVVPALFNRMENLRPVYLIPDGRGGWMETSPAAHDRYFDLADVRSKGKLRKLSQLIKWWKFSRAEPIPIMTFHVDMLMAANDLCAGVKPYTVCLYQAFKLLADRECRGLHDPCKVAGTIYAAQTDPQWRNVCDAVNYALEHATAAVAAEAAKNFREANRQWEIVFNGEI